MKNNVYYLEKNVLQNNKHMFPVSWNYVANPFILFNVFIANTLGKGYGLKLDLFEKTT